jgi:hypothetical protein
VGFFTLKAATSTLPVVKANANIADVTANAADTYLTGSSLNITGLLQAGSIFRWRFAMTKTGAGVAAPVFTVRVGTGGSTSDTARLTFTLPNAQTAATDTGFCELECIVRTFSSTGVVQGVLEFQHKNTTTGLSTAAQVQIVEVTSSTFDLTVSNSIVGVSCNPGASGVWTFQTVSVVASNLIQ